MAWSVQSSNPGSGNDWFLLQGVATSCETPASIPSSGSGCLFPGSKAAGACI
jgi:hypothetical protein